MKGIKPVAPLVLPTSCLEAGGGAFVTPVQQLPAGKQVFTARLLVGGGAFLSMGGACFSLGGGLVPMCGVCPRTQNSEEEGFGKPPRVLGTFRWSLRILRGRKTAEPHRKSLEVCAESNQQLSSRRWMALLQNFHLQVTQNACIPHIPQLEGGKFQPHQQTEKPACPVTPPPPPPRLILTTASSSFVFNFLKFHLNSSF